jgi:hypothetical protein
MPVDDLNVCEWWDLAPISIPPRSRLYHLEPVGAGTPNVESLTGYVARLAEAHSVPTKKLVVHELLPLLGRPHLSRPVNNALTSFWSNSTRALNGIRTLARDWVQVLEALTLRDDLRFSTLLTWSDVLTTNGLQRATRAWCPVCYEEWRESGQTVYEPLLWTLQEVVACPRHRRRLRLECPHQDCQHSLPLLAPWSRPGYCSRCERWLGVPPEKGSLGDEALTEEELKWQTWVVDAVGELLAAAPGLSTPPPKASIAEALAVYVEQVTAGDAWELARRMGLAKDRIWHCIHLGYVPRLELLLKLCHCFGTSPLRFLTADQIVVDLSRINFPVLSQLPARPKTSPKPFDTAGLRRALETVLTGDEDPPPPMRQVAKRLGYRHADLHNRFPDLCRAISARYLAYRKEQSRQKIQRLCDEVRQAIYRIDAQGMYPSAARVAALLRAPGSIRHPAVLATRRETLRELGWES